MPGLNVSDVVSVTVDMAPTSAPLRNFGAFLIAGASNVIDVGQRIRMYTTLDDVSNDFGSTMPEWLAADLFFSQAPQPSLLYIGRFAQTATSGVLHGAIQTPFDQATMLSLLQTITNGSMKITIDGVQQTVQATYAQLNGTLFSSDQQTALLLQLQTIAAGGFQITINGTVVNITNLNFANPIVADLPTVAAMINTALGTHGNCTWDPIAGQFGINSSTAGAASTITYASAPTTGTDISGDLGLTQASGSFAPINGTAGMNFTQITNLNGAATIVGLAMANASCEWDATNGQFDIFSLSTGPNSSVSYASQAGTGTDVATLMGFTQASGAGVPVNGIPAETALAAAIALRAHPEWYAMMFALPSELSNTDRLAVANFIEGCSPSSMYCYTTQNTACLDPTQTTDIFSVMKGADLQRTFGQFSSSSPYAVASAFARAATVDFTANNTVITLKFKQQPGVTGEYLTETQAAALKAKNGNVFVFYSNAVAILQEGIMANGYFFDEVQGLDWQANQVQTDLFNVLYTSLTKIPQTDPGVHILTTTVSNSLAMGVNNGLIAPGQWNGPSFGQITTGQQLPQGYYVWAPTVASQDQATRDKRIAPTIQAAVKLAGAVHFANCIINVNR